RTSERKNDTEDVPPIDRFLRRPERRIRLQGAAGADRRRPRKDQGAPRNGGVARGLSEPGPDTGNRRDVSDVRGDHRGHLWPVDEVHEGEGIERVLRVSGDEQVVRPEESPFLRNDELQLRMPLVLRLEDVARPCLAEPDLAGLEGSKVPLVEV